MRAHQEDRALNQPKSKRSFRWIIFSAAMLLTGLGVYFFLSTKQTPTIKIPKSTHSLIEEFAPLPEIPFVNIDSPDFILPILDESDGEFRTQLIGITDEFAPWLQFEELIRRGVTFNDGLSRGEVMTSLLSLPPPDGKFAISQQEDGVYLSHKNYQRYGVIEKILSSINPEKLVALFHLFRPLLEQAYGELGYKPEDFDASVIYTLEEILATPAITEPIALQLETVHYTFANPELEQLSSLQKQLVRMGPTTTQILQKKSQIIKDRLLSINDH